MKRSKTRCAVNLAVAAFLFCLFVLPVCAEYRDLKVTVMTRNMYAGADLGAIAAAQNVDEFRAAVIATLESAVQSRIPERAALVAAEIAQTKPDLVALQEVTIWQIEGESGPLVLDQLEILLEFLQAYGQRYRKAVVHTLTEVAIPGIASYTDRDVILVRADLPPGHLMILGSESRFYQALLSFNILGETIDVLRGWTALDVKIRGARFKFVNTHLEAPLPGDLMEATQYLQLLQAMQLMSDLMETGLPVILAGDFNSDAEPTIGYPPDETESYEFILGSGYAEAWEQLRPEDPGFTWPLPLGTDGNVVPVERIDLIFSNGPQPASITSTGATPDSSGLFASDHAGVVAVFQLENHRPDHLLRKRGR